MTFLKLFLICLFKNPKFVEKWTNLAGDKIKLRKVHGVCFFHVCHVITRMRKIFENMHKFWNNKRKTGKNGNNFMYLSQFDKDFFL